MHGLGLSGLVGAYVLMALLLLGLVVFSRWPWQLKAGVIIITSLFYVITYLSYPPLSGWPVDDMPPERFRLIHAYVEPPGKHTGFKGAIYLWLTGINDLSAPAVPRAYRLNYSESLHQQILNTNSKLNRGIPQLGEFRILNESANILFYDLPDPMFPDK